MIPPDRTRDNGAGQSKINSKFEIYLALKMKVMYEISQGLNGVYFLYSL